MENNKNRNRIILISLLVIILVSITIGITYAFFNYTRTGLANNISTGRIYFNTSQNGRLNLTNIFPVKSTDVDANTLDSVTVTITGDTTYEDGEEFQITLVDVQNTVNGKQIPINFIATYEANTDSVIGTSSDTYFTSRESKDASIYLLNGTGAVEENKQVLVGYIDNGQAGINGTLTIKAYIDADRIAISDTYDSANPGTDNMGTTSTWVDGRTVFTTTEWNSFQSSGTPISFKIKAESNEGIWVEEPAQGTIESCPDCKFMYYMADQSDQTTAKWTTWNQGIWDDTNSEYVHQTPTQITTGLYENYEELIAETEKNYFLGVKLNSNNEVTNAYACGVKEGTPFCIEGTSDGSKYTDNQTLLQGANLYNNACTVESSYTECGPWDNSGSLSARADSDGFVYAGVGNDGFCGVDPDGEFVCLESEAEEPSNGTIESCPNCKFIYTTDSLWTTWNTNNQSPTVLTSGYSTNYNDIVTNSGKNYFLGVVTNASNQITNAYACGIYNGTTPFCIEGTADGANYSSNSSLINGSNLWNNTCSVYSYYTECGPWNNSGSISVYAFSDGRVAAGVSGDKSCEVYTDGHFMCFESETGSSGDGGR